VPAPTVDAKPAALIVATVVVADFHVTVAVMSAVEASLKVPVAVNCCVRPRAMDGLGGVTAIEVSEMTVSVTAGVEVTPPCAAVICVVPAATAVANPVVEIVAVAVEEEFQVTVAETSAVEPSLKVAVAVNCCVPPTFRWGGVPGFTAIDVNVFPEL